MNERELKDFITPEFINTLQKVIDEMAGQSKKFSNEDVRDMVFDLDWDEIDFLPGILEDLKGLR
jgi:hypothetical protein